MYATPVTHFPKSFNVNASAIPFSVMTAVTTVHTDLALLSVANTTNAAITLTVQDAQATPQPLVYQINIEPNVPVILNYDPPQHMTSGLSWQASATGLIGTMRGTQIMNLQLGTASATTNNIRPPA